MGEAETSSEWQREDAVPVTASEEERTEPEEGARTKNTSKNIQLVDCFLSDYLPPPQNVTELWIDQWINLWIEQSLHVQLSLNT